MKHLLWIVDYGQASVVEFRRPSRIFVYKTLKLLDAFRVIYGKEGNIE